MATEHADKIKVLVLGLPRTGNSSIKVALEELGLQGVYHGKTTLENPEHCKLFCQMYEWKYEGKGSRLSNKQWHTILKDCEAITDSPCSDFYDELLDVYPHAKIILPVRDSADAWAQSAQKTILNFYPQIFLEWLGELGDRSWFGRMWRFHRKYVLPRDVLLHRPQSYYLEHERAIVRVAKERERDLLLFNAKEGWEPLCDFLDLDRPEGREFPHVYDSNTFLADQAAFFEARVRKGLSIGLVGALGATAGLLTWQRLRL